MIEPLFAGTIQVRNLQQQSPLKVLEALLAESPKSTIGFFQKSAEKDGVFRAEQTFIAFDALRESSPQGREAIRLRN